jgi:hypothetical protein
MRDHAAIETEHVGVRARLGAKAHGLHQRMTHLRAMVSPRTYVANPWLRIGAAVALGYWLGRREQPKPDVRHANRPETMFHALLRTALLNLAESAINDVMSGNATET